jgi:hypothetical protein
MTFDGVVETISFCYRAQVPLMIWGPPGCGKSAAGKFSATQIGQELGITMGYRDVRVSTLDPVDLRGMPFPDMDTLIVRWLRQGFLPDSGEGLLMLDEITSAAPAMQAALYQLALDRCIGDYQLPPGWGIIAAGNRMQDRGVAYRMATPLASRFCHVEMAVDVKVWTDWYWDTGLPMEVGMYVNFMPDMLFQFDPNSKDPAFPAPRTIEMAAKLYAQNPPKKLLHSLVEGCCGKDWVAGFIGFLKAYKDMPTIQSIHLNPDTAHIPSDPSALAGIAAGLAVHADTGNMAATMKYAERLPREYATLLVKQTLRLHPKLDSTPGVAKWQVKNTKYLSAA